MRLLLLGGPRFLGRAITDAALARGHELTYFNRGTTNPELYPEVERLVGDREGDLAPLRGGIWDAVIDTCGYVPHVVAASVDALAESPFYCFVSSISVYADVSSTLDEESPLQEPGDDPIDRLTEDYSNYGALKGLCEEVVRRSFGDRALVVRPGLIVGPHDPSGRFTYWPHRIARGGEVLAPAPPYRHVEFVDVRDLAEWILELCEQRVDGTFNATNTEIAWSELLESCLRVASSDCTLTWIPDDFLLKQEVGQWMELPLWIADRVGSGATRPVVDRALAAGLRFRPLDETVLGTLESAEPTSDAGLSLEREAELLRAWHGRG